MSEYLSPLEVLNALAVGHSVTCSAWDENNYSHVEVSVGGKMLRRMKPDISGYSSAESYTMSIPNLVGGEWRFYVPKPLIKGFLYELVGRLCDSNELRCMATKSFVRADVTGGGIMHLTTEFPRMKKMLSVTHISKPVWTLHQRNEAWPQVESEHD